MLYRRVCVMLIDVFGVRVYCPVGGEDLSQVSGVSEYRWKASLTVGGILVW